jgi:hypothetical protein
MLRRFTSRLPAIAMAGLLILGLSQRAHADLTLTLVGVGTQSTAGNGSLAINLAGGGLTATGSASGETALLAPAHMDLGTTTVTATTPAVAEFIFAMDHINSPVGLGTISETLTAHFITGSGSVTFQTFGANGNHPYTSLPLMPAPTGMTGIVNTLNGSSSGAFTATAPYTLVQVLTITFNTSGSASISTDSSANFTAGVPEPTSMAMAGLGALGFIAYGLRRRKASGA